MQALSGTGIGLRAVHHQAILTGQPGIPWLEAHSENYFAAGGPQREYLRKIRASYPLSLHGVGLSLGSTDPLDQGHLRALAALVREFEPTLISEHLSWSSVGGTFANDLLPLPYTEEALRHLAARVGQVQDFLGQQLLMENVSSYLRFADAPFSEWEFIAALANESDCALLVDVNNVYVSAMNHGFDALAYLSALPTDRVKEIHLAGHSIRRIGEEELRIDTHDRAVCPEVMELYRIALQRFGPVPTLIEWDTDIPALEVLMAEARKADQILEEHRALAA